MKECHQTFKSTSKKKTRTSTATIKSALAGKQSYESLFLKYAGTPYNQVPKQIQEAEIYCDVVPKLKKYFY